MHGKICASPDNPERVFLSPVWHDQQGVFGEPSLDAVGHVLKFEHRVDSASSSKEDPRWRLLCVRNSRAPKGGGDAFVFHLMILLFQEGRFDCHGPEVDLLS